MMGHKTSHDPDCSAVRQDDWDSPWCPLPNREWGSEDCPYVEHGRHVWWLVFPCNDPDCTAEIQVKADRVLEHVLGNVKHIAENTDDDEKQPEDSALQGRDVEIVSVGDVVYCIRDDGKTAEITDRETVIQLLKGDWPDG